MIVMSFSERLQNSVVRLLRRSEKYTKTDMVYLAHGSFWLFLGQAAAVFFSLGLAIIFGHLATQDTYGNYKYIISLSSLLSVVSLSGLGTAVTRAAARGDEGSLKQGFAMSLKYTGFIVLAGFCASAFYLYTGNVFAGTGLALATITLPFINSFSLFDSFLVGLKEFRLDTLFTVGSLAFTSSALAVTLLFFSQRAIILVAVFFLTNLLSDAIWYFLSLRKARNQKNDAGMFHYGFHLSAMGVIGAIADKIDSIIIFTFLGPAQLAIYSYAIAVPEQIKGLLKNIGPLAMPKFAQSSISDIKATVWPKIMLLAGIIVIVISIYIATAAFLFNLLFPVYLSSIIYSQIYALSLLFSFITPLSSVFQAHKKTRELYYFSNVPAIVLIIALPTLTYLYGIAGAIASQILYRATTATVALILFRNIKD